MLFAVCLLGALVAMVAGMMPLAGLLALAAVCCLLRRRVRQNAGFPRPVIHYLPQPVPYEPLIRLERGQTATVPWPHPLQVLLPEGVRLQILEVTSKRVRIVAL